MPAGSFRVNRMSVQHYGFCNFTGECALACTCPCHAGTWADGSLVLAEDFEPVTMADVAAVHRAIRDVPPSATSPEWTDHEGTAWRGQLSKAEAAVAGFDTTYAASGRECRRMRDASGRIDDSRPLVAFLYLLARDEMPVGEIETMLDALPGEGSSFTNGWLAQWAQDAATRLLPDPQSPFRNEDGRLVLPETKENQ